jgi:hypothetical protein
MTAGRSALDPGAERAAGRALTSGGPAVLAGGTASARGSAPASGSAPKDPGNDDSDPVAEAGQGEVRLPGGQGELAVARQIRARALAAGQGPAEIAAAIADDCGMTRIRAYRLALGVPLADVVAQVGARYEADGRPVPKFSETLLSAYESGHKRPGREYLHYLSASYLADPADLGFDGRCLCGRSHQAASIAGPASVAGLANSVGLAFPAGLAAPQARTPPSRTATAHDSGDRDDDGDELRATLLRQMTEPGSPVDGRFLGAVDRIRGRMDEALLRGTVSVAMLDRWEQDVAGYGRQYMTVPPLLLLCDVLLDLAEVRRMCEERQPVEVSERLCRLAAQLAGLGGISMVDLGDHRLARSFFRTARTAADETGDRQLRAWVTVREALVPMYYGDPREAAGLAGAAADLAGRQLCAAAVMAPVIKARAQARLVSLGRTGRRTALERAKSSLDRAAEALADMPASQRCDTAFGYTERQLHFHGGDILVVLGDWQAAHREFGQAAQLYGSTEVLDRALVAFGQARCLLAAGEPDQALALGGAILADVPSEHRTAVILQVARSLGRDAASRDPRLRALADYRSVVRSA